MARGLHWPETIKCGYTKWLSLQNSQSGSALPQIQMSYLQHFHLDQPPFGLTPDPEFVYWSKQHARAKAYMESTIWLADGFVVITGEVGSGKTTLLQSLLSELEDDVVYATVSQTQLTPTQFLQAVLTEFGFRPFNKRKVELLDMLNSFLIEQYANGNKVLLIIDEAQNLSSKVLEEVRLLSGIETHKEKVLRIILAGQPELRDTLDDPGLRQLMQRVRLRFHIDELNPKEMREYVTHRLAVAGNENPALFAEDSYARLFDYTGGVPRLINTLCDTALLCAFADEKHSVDDSIIASAIEELGWLTFAGATGTYRRMPHIVPDLQEQPQLAKIELRSDGETLSEYLFGSDRIIVGRAEDNEIFVKSKYVSRHHAQLISRESGCTIEDLNSTNGIYVGNRRVKKYLLKDGDTVTLGIHELVYTDLRDADASEESAAGGSQG